MKNLEVILAEAGATFDDVVKTTLYITDMALYPRINKIYQSYFKDTYPARETVEVRALPAGVKLEISMTAVK